MRRETISRMVRRAVTAVLLTGAFSSAMGAGLSSAEQYTAPRDQTIAVLESVTSAPADLALGAWVNEGEAGGIPIGARIEYHFRSDQVAHLTVLHVDSHGVATVLYPNGLDSGNLLDAGVERTFPASQDGFVVRAQPPVGREYVFAVATAVPIPPEALGLSFARGPLAVFEAADAPALARRLREQVLALDRSARAMASFEQLILGRSDRAEYEASDIIAYFTTRTRSIRRPRLDLHVHFASGAHELDARARRDLDRVAEALQDGRMREMRFTVSGHTDDVGDESYNDGLSLQRARSVVRYLTGEQGIDPQRFATEHHGETRPLVADTTREARKLNRRVEFELLR